jgi:hypothetical protein
MTLELNLKPLDSNNPPAFKTQMLFYWDKMNIFKLGSVDYIREDQNGRQFVYKSFEDISCHSPTGVIKITFTPTHYLDLELGELAKTIKDNIL